jgi:putative drug exporter of the RND superfamily
MTTATEPMRERVLAGRAARAFARGVSKLRFLIVLLWVGGALAATLLLPSLSESGDASLGGVIAEDSESITARARSAELFRLPILSEIAVVQRDANGLSEEAQQHVFERAAAVFEQGGESDPVFAIPISNTARLFPGSRENSTTAVTYLFFSPELSIGDQRALAEDWAQRNIARPDDHLVGVTGALPARVEEAHRVHDSLIYVEIATVLVIAAILGLTFRSPGAPLVVLFSAGLGYLVTITALPWVGERLGVDMPPEIEPLVVVLLVGIVTDYAIFFLSGFRTRLIAGEPRLEAARHATAQNVPIVLTAGLIVAAGALTLLAGQLDYFRVLGPGMALTAIVGLIASVTLIPALLGIFGRAVFWPSRRSVVPAQDEREASVGVTAAAPATRPLRERFAFFVAARPVAALIVVAAVAGLVVAASGLRDLNLGFTLIRGLPEDSEPRQAYEALEQGFAPGVVAPTEIVLEQQGLAGRRAALIRLQALIAQEKGVAGVLGPRDEPADIATNAVFAENGNAARMAVILEQAPLGARAIDDLDALDNRMDVLLREVGLPDTTVAFGGDTALARDTVRITLSDLERIALAALGVNLLFLIIFLRSFVAPLFLLATSVLALAATLGLTSYLFQDLLGYEEVTYYVPFAAAVLLVSLGSDYNVFVVGRVWEEARRRPLREAIATAAPRASKTITVAALALAASFATLAIVPLRAFRELAFALAVGVLIDAFMVRSLLVPALISLFGDLSWWPGTRRIIRTRTALGQPDPEAAEPPPPNSAQL